MRRNTSEYNLALDKSALEKQLKAYLGTKKFGYWVTLNTDVKIDDPLDPSFRRHKKVLDEKVEKIGLFLKKYCFGRKYKRGKTDLLLRGVSTIEVGGKSGRLHAHIVLTHGGGTTRSAADVKTFISRIWSKMFRTNGAAVFVDVQEFDCSQDPIRYMTKQTKQLWKLHGETNYMLH